MIYIIYTIQFGSIVTFINNVIFNTRSRENSKPYSYLNNKTVFITIIQTQCQYDIKLKTQFVLVDYSTICYYFTTVIKFSPTQQKPNSSRNTFWNYKHKFITVWQNLLKGTYSESVMF